MRLVNIKQLSDRLGCARCTIWRMVKRGELPRPIYLHSSPRWDIEVIEALLSKRTTSQMSRYAILTSNVAAKSH